MSMQRGADYSGSLGVAVLVLEDATGYVFLSDTGKRHRAGLPDQAITPTEFSGERAQAPPAKTSRNSFP